jgi:Cysteine-rich secretory protein family
MRCFGVLLTAVLCSAFCGTLLYAQEVTSQGPGSVAEQYLFTSANAERVQRGLQPLRWDGALYRAAQAHAQEMASRASISHQYPGELELAARGRQAGARFSSISENVAQSSTAVKIHDAWMNSTGHRDNLLDPLVDAVGISVLRRNGQLYAVEDFGHTVEDLTVEEQEGAVGVLLTAAAPLTLLSIPEDARRTCTMETGYAGARRPGFVMRYTEKSLTQLPSELKQKLATGKYSEAAVGACAARDDQPFSYFNIVVLLYP